MKECVVPKFRPIVAVALLLSLFSPSAAYAAETTSSLPVAAAHAPSRQVPLKVVKTALGTYVVVSGDTLSGIAPRFSMTWPDLWSLNKTIIANPDLIFPGQRLSTSGTAAPAAPAAPAPQPVSGWTSPTPGVCVIDGWHSTAGRDFPHEGIDLAASWGTPIHSPFGGVVVSTGWSQLGGYDTAIRHDNGVWTAYMHQSSRTVSYGQRVEAGQVIGYTGNTGVVRAGGPNVSPHLHFEVNTAGPFAGDVDPIAYLRARGVSINWC